MGIWKLSGKRTSRNFKMIFHITEQLVLHHHVEILNVKTSESTSPSWTRSTLSHDQVIKWTKARVRVYSDSALCLEKMSDYLEANRRWEGQEERISTVRLLQRINIRSRWRTDWVRVEYFPRTCVIEKPPENPERSARSKHWTWEIWRSNHLQVKVQWHRLDPPWDNPVNPWDRSCPINQHLVAACMEV